MSIFKLLTRRRLPAIRFRPRRTTHKDWQALLIRVGVYDWHLVTRRGYGVSLWGINNLGVFIPWWEKLSWYGDLLVIKRRQPNATAPEVSHLAPVESNVLARCQALVSHCAATKFDDGTARTPGWFTIRTRGSAWEIEIKDPETCCRLVIIQQTLDDALALATCLLDAEDAPWETDQWLTAARAKQKRK
jgi:hypothetical protein